MTLVRSCKAVCARFGGEMPTAATAGALFKLHWVTAIMTAAPKSGSSVEAIQNAARVLMEEIKQLMKVPAVQNCRPAMVRCGEAQFGNECDVGDNECDLGE